MRQHGLRVGLVALALVAACEPDEVVRTPPAGDGAAGLDADADAEVDAGATSRDGAEVDGPDARDAGAEAGEPIHPPADGGTWWLSETGLYADITTARLAPGVARFAPGYPLWSDGADKDRFVALPEGAVIDTADMDHWQFPVGTRFWKEFRRQDRRLETRLIVRTGPRPKDYWMGAFLWEADGRDARFVRDGARDVHGTDHDVPAADVCWSCHLGEPGRVLGFSALQLGSSTGPLTLADLVAGGRLSQPPPADGVAVPGAGDVREALGTLHANCGACHNPNGIARPDTDLMLRLSVAERAPEATALYGSTVGVPLQKFNGAEVTLRIVAGDPDRSGIVVRMATRDPKWQMPPLATKHIDDAAVAVVRSWIKGLGPP